MAIGAQVGVGWFRDEGAREAVVMPVNPPPPFLETSGEKSPNSVEQTYVCAFAQVPLSNMCIFEKASCSTNQISIYSVVAALRMFV